MKNFTRKNFASFCENTDLKNNTNFAKAGFTLAEVLITLGIIGVVAAMTIPNLMTKLNSIKLKSQYREAYSLLSQAIKMFNADESRVLYHHSKNPDSTEKDFDYDYITAEVLAKYFKGATQCASLDDVDSKFCIGRKETDSDGNTTVTNKDYKYTNYAKNTSYLTTNPFDDWQFYLNNGMLFILDGNVNTWGHQLLTIDINGKGSKPNAAGHDLFVFELRESEKEGGFEIVPAGSPDSYFKDKSKYCSKTSNNHLNGIGCAYYAMTNDTYFKDLP